MMTFSPMLACGPSFGPEILVIFIPWVVGIVAGLINTVMICMRIGEPSSGFGNAIFFMGYIGLAAAFVRGVFGSVDSGLAMALFFGIPVLPVGHTVYLFYDWRKKRKLEKQREEN